jgi:hypothetical protein
VGAAIVADGHAKPAGAGRPAVGEAADGYIPSASWRGVQRGHVFKTGPAGVGYYRDELAAGSQPLGGTAPPPPPPPPPRADDADGGADADEAADDADGDQVGAARARGEVGIAQKQVPVAIFGSAGLAEKRSAEEEPMGALERFKRKK